MTYPCSFTKVRILPNLIGLLLALVASLANSTTLLSMDIDRVAQDAEFIFEGEVMLTEARQDSGSGIISTYVTFTIIDVVKGDYDAESIELKFMGGVFNGRIVEVSGLTIPEPGEKGIYFVESTSRDLVNPLLGWSQGHFIIKDDNGERRISTVDDIPVTDVQAVAAIPPSIKKPQSLIEGKGDVAAGIITDTSPLRVERALTVENFKSRIRELVGN